MLQSRLRKSASEGRSNPRKGWFWRWVLNIVLKILRDLIDDVINKRYSCETRDFDLIGKSRGDDIYIIDVRKKRA